MNVNITQFDNPFSFFCKTSNEVNIQLNITKYTNEVNSIVPGQYVALLWKNKWVRGVVLENKAQIWLIDYGVYYTPYDKTVCTGLNQIYKKLPSNVFEASIHGIMPLQLELSFEALESTVSTKWSAGAISRAKELISASYQTCFVPVAILTTGTNDIVLGDLFLKSKHGEIINIIDKLEEWPSVISRNIETYIQNLSQLYTAQKKHYACIKKPPISDIPSITPSITVGQFNDIYFKRSKFDNTSDIDSSSEDEASGIDKDKLFTPEEIEYYSRLYVTIGGEKRNLLYVMKNKLLDEMMCKKYKNHDVKCVGRGVTRGSKLKY